MFDQALKINPYLTKAYAYKGKSLRIFYQDLHFRAYKNLMKQ